MVIFSIVIGGLTIGVIVFMVIMLTNPDKFTKNKPGEMPKSKQAADTGAKSGKEDAKDFLPMADVDGIKDGVIDLGRHRYRAILEVSSLNYFFMSEEDQRIVEVSYQGFLNSITFPIEFYIQTRDFDSDTMLENLEKNVAETVINNPGTKDYLEEYLAFMKELGPNIGNPKIKKKYIVVSFNDTEITSDLSELTGEELKEFSLEELNNRCEIVSSGLAGCGLSVKRLNDKEIMECIYAYVHRSMYRIANDIADGMLTTLVINSKEDLTPDRDEKLRAILNEAQNKINADLREKDFDAETDGVYGYINAVMEYMKSPDGIAEMKQEYGSQGLRMAGERS